MPLNDVVVCQLISPDFPPLYWWESVLSPFSRDSEVNKKGNINDIVRNEGTLVQHGTPKRYRPRYPPKPRTGKRT